MSDNGSSNELEGPWINTAALSNRAIVEIPGCVLAEPVTETRFIFKWTLRQRIINWLEEKWTYLLEDIGIWERRCRCNDPDWGENKNNYCSCGSKCRYFDDEVEEDSDQTS